MRNIMNREENKRRENLWQARPAEGLNRCPRRSSSSTLTCQGRASTMVCPLTRRIHRQRGGSLHTQES